ncbi:hypothetical protein CRI77_15335 [Mycolicibacterium duvalii]|uniref:Uncharacterized protein n=1 Tax=Mycolicibacterium duvalii TaxID=39688 RepID=A0A7I7K363_9MYCO|nr:hypothetical protein CRI77_15335 [Mycolicibacterium duvalii]BBX17998.1 hypothetical protein MDUV_28580 [Mycolicibacterium duvalii]
MLARIDAGPLQLTGEAGFLPAMIRAVQKRGLAAELTEYLGYEKGSLVGRREHAPTAESKRWARWP